MTTHSSSSDPPTPAETLRQMANQEAYAADVCRRARERHPEDYHHKGTEDIDKHVARQAACDAGAHAWEIVRELADEYSKVSLRELLERARRLVEDR